MYRKLPLLYLQYSENPNQTNDDDANSLFVFIAMERSALLMLWCRVMTNPPSYLRPKL
jgi:hypothetical protein